MKYDLISLIDGYKIDHRRQYQKGTTSIYSNWTPRSSRIPGVEKVVFFGLQYVLQHCFMELANDTFFNRNIDSVLASYQKRLDGYLGPNNVGTKHIADLHKLGYIPLEFKALPEGTHVPLRVPMVTVENTHPDFFWVTNYFESMLSNLLWKGCTSATNAYRMRQLFMDHAILTHADVAFVDWQGHDFSFRGMSGIVDAAISGAGHLLSFTGTDTLPALDLLEQYYFGQREEILGMSVPATEHSVMCSGGMQNETDTYSCILDLYPTGIVSIVSDTWDLWHVIGHILPILKDKILARDGKTVIRPDSGDPTLILCGDPDHKGTDRRDHLIRKGVVESLWDLFGGTYNSGRYKELNQHIGAIYGDSISYDRANDILTRLGEKGFASTNVVFGLGSYFYEYVTRDTFGFAMKATASVVDGKEHMLFKDPKTDDGVKRSARGRIVVLSDWELGYGDSFKACDGLNKEQQRQWAAQDQLQLVWRNGVFYKQWTVGQIRERIRKE